MMPGAMRSVLCVILLVACGGATRPAAKLNTAGDRDPDGPHRARIAELVRPYIEGEIATGIVIGISEAGRREIYGFGKGPGGAPPSGATLFEIGSITKTYTALLFADAVQRRAVALDTPVAELLPPGVTAPTKDKSVITLKHLALHTSGLPRVPPTLVEKVDRALPDPYAGYSDEMLFADL